MTDKSILRQSILDVIDEGNPNDKRDCRWHFDAQDQATATKNGLQLGEGQRESLANLARLDFSDRVLARYEKLVREAAVEQVNTEPWNPETYGDAQPSD